ncbi:MAG: hypothetical protein JOZ73_11990 [Solirubrobacterales bacterium]|nr:hypothetical protein [Solirubrobacterales bacterium]
MGDYDNYLQSRRMQGQQLAQYAAIMRGAPTAAQRQVQAGTQQAAAAQQGIASSYRGQGAGIAAAHMAALYGGAQARAVGSQNLALQQQQDQIAATQGYSGLANQLRQSDLARQGMSQDQAYRVAQMQGQNNAQNDAMEQYYAQQGFNVENQQLQAAGQYESQDAYNKLGSAGLLAQQDAFNRQQNSQNIAGYLSAFGALAAAAA